MSRFEKLSQTIWHCQYHVEWVPKYRFRISTEEIAEEAARCIRVFSERFEVEVIELNIQPGHVYLLAMVPPKLSISDYVGTAKGRAINILNKFRKLKKKPYWGNHFWAKGYCVDTVGLDVEMIRKYIRYQEDQEKRTEQLKLF